MAFSDSIVMIILIIIILITAVMSYIVLDEMQTIVSSSDLGINTTFFEQGKQGLLAFDAMAVFILIGLGGGVVVSAFLVRTHPVFIVVGIVILGLQVMMSAMVSNVFIDIATSTTLIADTVDLFPVSAAVIQNLPLITLGFSALALMVSFGKSPSTPQGEF